MVGEALVADHLIRVPLGCWMDGPQVDPFFVPTTEEEREEWGEEAVNVSNVARRFIDAVRR